MRRLFRPECPCDPAAKSWIETKLAWLSAELPDNVFTGRPMVLPTPDFFPGRYDRTEATAAPLLDRVCGYMDVAPERITVTFVDEDPNPLHLVNADGQRMATAAGTYERGPTDGSGSLGHLIPGQGAAVLTHTSSHSGTIAELPAAGALPGRLPSDLATVIHQARPRYERRRLTRSGTMVVEIDGRPISCWRRRRRLQRSYGVTGRCDDMGSAERCRTTAAVDDGAASGRASRRAINAQVGSTLVQTGLMSSGDSDDAREGYEVRRDVDVPDGQVSLWATVSADAPPTGDDVASSVGGDAAELSLLAQLDAQLASTVGRVLVDEYLRAGGLSPRRRDEALAQLRLHRGVTAGRTLILAVDLPLGSGRVQSEWNGSAIEAIEIGREMGRIAGENISSERAIVGPTGWEPQYDGPSP